MIFVFVIVGIHIVAQALACPCVAICIIRLFDLGLHWTRLLPVRAKYMPSLYTRTLGSATHPHLFCNGSATLRHVLHPFRNHSARFRDASGSILELMSKIRHTSALVRRLFRNAS